MKRVTVTGAGGFIDHGGLPEGRGLLGARGGHQVAGVRGKRGRGVPALGPPGFGRRRTPARPSTVCRTSTTWPQIWGIG